MARAESLPDYCRRLLDEVVEVSDYPIRIEEHSALEFDSVIQLAPLKGWERHMLGYIAPYRAHLPHFIVSAAYKILRFYKAEPEERYWIRSIVP